jgi:dTDP-4-dehydrorhamnose reductase
VKEKFLIIGSDSLIGQNLFFALDQAGEDVIKTTRRKNYISAQSTFLELGHDSINNWIIPEGITVAFFLAGITSITYCQKYPKRSYKVNVQNTIKLIERLIEKNIFIVFPSTNLVFNGEKPFSKENDPVSPTTLYGKQKVEVEQYLLSKGKTSCILRLTKIAESLLPLLKEWALMLYMNKIVNPFSDKYLAPVSLVHCIQVMLAIAKNRYTGIFQFSGDRDISYEQLCMCLANSIIPNSNYLNFIKPVTSKELLPMGSTRNKYTTLDTGRLNHEIALILPSSRDSLYSIINNVKEWLRLIY